MCVRENTSGCKCGICAPMAHKFCAQQTASLLSETPSGVFDRRKKPDAAASGFLYAENRFPGDESQRGLVVIHILLVQSTSQFSSPSRRQSLPQNNPQFAPAFHTMFVDLENAKTSLFLALVRKVFFISTTDSFAASYIAGSGRCRLPCRADYRYTGMYRNSYNVCQILSKIPVIFTKITVDRPCG